MDRTARTGTVYGQGVFSMPDKQPHHHDHKKLDKGHAIKAKRAEKKARGATDESADPVAHITKKH